MYIRRYLATMLLGLAVSTSAVGCAAIMAALPTIIAAVTDAVIVLDQIEAWIRRYFAAHPNPEKEEQVAKAIGKTRNALNAANRTCAGVEKLDQVQVDAAFADFKVAYQELTALCAGLPGAGLRVKQPNEGPLLMATDDMLSVPPASALVPRIK